MKELDFIEIIRSTLSDNSFIGNDCADLKDIGLFITQDSLVEDVHFSLKTTTPYKLGIKAVAVNISDLATVISNPEYISIGLSVPSRISNDFVREFYEGINFACNKYNVKVTGGDITASDKIYISITAIGRRRHDIDVSRSFAKPGDFILSTGYYGTSAAGLYALTHGKKVSDTIIDAHLTPEARLFESYEVGKYAEDNLAIMDTSDGLADALYKVAAASNVSVKVNFDDIPVLEEVKNLSKSSNVNLQDWVLWGGEDFELLFFVPYYIFSSLDCSRFKYVGIVTEKSDSPSVEVLYGDEKFIIDKNLLTQKSYNHFGG